MAWSHTKFTLASLFFLGAVAVFSTYNQDGSIDASLGELFITNIGEGDEAGYERLHQSRMRVARLAGQLFRSELEALAAEYPDEIPKLSRAIMANRHPEPGYERPAVDPLIDMVAEGGMSVGQATNALVQAGVEGQASVEADIREVLAERLPLLYARILTVGRSRSKPNGGSGRATHSNAYRQRSAATPKVPRASGK